MDLVLNLSVSLFSNKTKGDLMGLSWDGMVNTSNGLALHTFHRQIFVYGFHPQSVLHSLFLAETVLCVSPQELFPLRVHYQGQWGPVCPECDLELSRKTWRKVSEKTQIIKS